MVARSSQPIALKKNNHDRDNVPSCRSEQRGKAAQRLWRHSFTSNWRSMALVLMMKMTLISDSAHFWLISCFSGSAMSKATGGHWTPQYGVAQRSQEFLKQIYTEMKVCIFWSIQLLEEGSVNSRSKLNWICLRLRTRAAFRDPDFSRCTTRRLVVGLWRLIGRSSFSCRSCLSVWRPWAFGFGTAV